MVELVDSVDLGSTAVGVQVRVLLPAPTIKEGAVAPSFIVLLRKDRTRTQLHAARTSAAGDGLTEPIFDSLKSCCPHHIECS